MSVFSCPQPNPSRPGIRPIASKVFQLLNNFRVKTCNYSDNERSVYSFFAIILINKGMVFPAHKSSVYTELDSWLKYNSSVK